jgi:hypothetical protein
MPANLVFSKWKAGKLHSGSKTGPKVKSHKQAIAIYLSEKRKEKAHGGKYPEKKADGGETDDRLPNPFMDVNKYTPRPLTLGKPPVTGGALGFWEHPSPKRVIPVTGKADGGNVIPLPLTTRWQRDQLRRSILEGKRAYEASLPEPTHPPISMEDIEDKVQGKAFGGPNLDRFNMENMVMRGSMYGLRHEGMINSSIPGRTDRLPMSVKSGSYVLPADIPSALGQGNSMAGGQILKKMFSSGPYGLAPMHGMGRGSGQPRMSWMRPPSMPRTGIPGAMPKMGSASGGAHRTAPGHVPIIAAGGEFIISPEVVRDVGHGDISAGHKVLDKFVMNIRKKYHQTLKNLPPPKK